MYGFKNKLTPLWWGLEKNLFLVSSGGEGVGHFVYLNSRTCSELLVLTSPKLVFFISSSCRFTR